MNELQRKAAAPLAGSISIGHAPNAAAIAAPASPGDQQATRGSPACLGWPACPVVRWRLHRLRALRRRLEPRASRRVPHCAAIARHAPWFAFAGSLIDPTQCIESKINRFDSTTIFSIGLIGIASEKPFWTQKSEQTPFETDRQRVSWPFLCICMYVCGPGWTNPMAASNARRCMHPQSHSQPFLSPAIQQASQPHFGATVKQGRRAVALLLHFAASAWACGACLCG